MNEAFKKFSQDLKAALVESLASAGVKELIAKTKAAEDSGTFEVVISTADQDRQGEIVDQSGWDFANYLKNPVVLWAHDYASLPIAVTDEIKTVNGVTIAKGRFAPEDANPFAQQVRKLYDLKMLQTTSVGFIAKEMEENTITKAELLEFSFVPVPANPFALSLRKAEELHLDLEMMRTKGIEFKEKDNEPETPPAPEEKGAVPFHETPAAPEDEPWDADKAKENLAKYASKDGSGDKDTIDWDKYAEGFAWFDGSAKEEFGSYKLPHHDTADGKLMVVWSGVKAAMEALMGSRGGTDIPEADYDAVHSHLAKHYAQFEKEPPTKAFVKKDAEDITEIMGMMGTMGDMISAMLSLHQQMMIELAEMQSPEPDETDDQTSGKSVKAGRELSEKNRALIKECVTKMKEITAALEDLHSATEPQGDGEKTPKQRSKDAGSDEQALNEWLFHRQVLRSINNATSDALAKFNAKVRTNSKKQ